MVETELEPGAWEGRCVNEECTLHQLSPFLGKMKSTMASELIKTYTSNADFVLDPFSGSGTVPLEAALNGRSAAGVDRNPYAIALSRAKLFPPEDETKAKSQANEYIDQIDELENQNISSVPDWVTEFFHPKTLAGLTQLFPLLRKNDEYFLLACLLGILHHQRPGFLSYPASHLKPYLRDKKFPRDEYPEKYGYREIRPRLISKIERAYRRFVGFQENTRRQIFQGDVAEVMNDNFNDSCVDAIITSPPYMNKLDYGRDNRLRLYFLGVDNYEDLDGSPKSKAEYREFLETFMCQASRVLKNKGTLVFVLGESRRSGSSVDTADVLLDVIEEEKFGFSVSNILQDKVPVREVNSMSSETETILTMTLGEKNV